MKEANDHRKILSFLLWVLILLIVLLLAVNAFFIWQLYFVTPAEPSKDDLINQTLTAVSLTEVVMAAPVEETPTLEAPTFTLQPTDSPEPPAETPSPAREELLYVVRQGDTVQQLAESNAIAVEDLRARNQMMGDFLLVDQKLYIPPQGERFEPMVVFSSMESEDAYLLMPQPASGQSTTFDIFMEENRLSFQAREQLMQAAKDAFYYVSEDLAGEPPALVTIFVASGPFMEQGAVRADFMTEGEPRLYVLHDGSGDLPDMNFHLAYGMARLWGEQVWGGSPDPVLQEGMAYALADQRNVGSGNLRLCDVAYTYQSVGDLPDLTSVSNWEIEWTRNMVNLATAGCYYQYLTETYSPEEVQALYTSGDYAPLQGEGFVVEVAAFEDWLLGYQPSQGIDAPAFVEQMDRLLQMNKLFFPDMAGWEYSVDIYYALDQARLGLWRNDVRYAMVRMTTAAAMLGLTNNLVELTPTASLTPKPGEQAQPDQPTPTENGFQWTPFPTKEWWKPQPTDDD